MVTIQAGKNYNTQYFLTKVLVVEQLNVHLKVCLDDNKINLPLSPTCMILTSL